MNHVLKTHDCHIEMDGNFKEQSWEWLGYQITKLATYPIPADCFIYLYEAYDCRIGEAQYFIVNHIPHRNEDGTFKRSIGYEAMEADNSFEAFREFIVEAEKHAF